MMQVRMVIAQAIENARNALTQQKQLNEYMSRIGRKQVVFFPKGFRLRSLNTCYCQLKSSEPHNVLDLSY